MPSWGGVKLTLTSKSAEFLPGGRRWQSAGDLGPRCLGSRFVGKLLRRHHQTVRRVVKNISTSAAAGPPRRCAGAQEEPPGAGVLRLPRALENSGLNDQRQPGSDERRGRGWGWGTGAPLLGICHPVISRGSPQWGSGAARSSIEVDGRSSKWSRASAWVRGVAVSGV
jgi:hypothetical protein